MAYHCDTFQHHKGWRENRAIGDRIVFHKFCQLHSLLKEYYYKPYVCAYDMLPAWKKLEPISVAPQYSPSQLEFYWNNFNFLFDRS